MVGNGVGIGGAGVPVGGTGVLVGVLVAVAGEAVEGVAEGAISVSFASAVWVALIDNSIGAFAAL